jgi:hypothetical protein
VTRSRPPTDPQPPTAAADPARAPRPRTPTRKGPGVEAAAPTRKSVELATPTAVWPPPRAQGEPALATPTAVSPPPRAPSEPAPALPPPPEPERSGPVHAAPAFDQSQPIRVISLKAPGDAPRADASAERLPRNQHQPRLRRLSEVSPQRRAALTPPGGLGYLAPPRDPREARTRRWREYVIWGSVAVMVAGVVTLGVWFLAGS